MVALNCAIVGVAGSAFPVDIDINEKTSVNGLKKKISKKIRFSTSGEANLLQLFLAKTESGAWLVSDGDDVKTLEKGGGTAVIEALTLKGKELKDDTDLQKTLEWMPPPSTDEVHVLVVLPAQQQAKSSQDQQHYTTLSPEETCCKYLDAIAQKLAKLYYYEFTFAAPMPTMVDVLRSIENESWSFRVKDGEQLTTTPLPEFFTEKQWKVVKELNQDTIERIYDGKMLTTSEEKPFVILPHEFFANDGVNRFKAIAEKGGIDLEVMDEEGLQ